MKQMCHLCGCHQPESPASHPLHLLGLSMYMVLFRKPPLLPTIQCLDRLIMVLFAFVIHCEPTHLLWLIYFLTCHSLVCFSII